MNQKITRTALCGCTGFGAKMGIKFCECFMDIAYQQNPCILLQFCRFRVILNYI